MLLQDPPHLSMGMSCRKTRIAQWAGVPKYRIIKGFLARPVKWYGCLCVLEAAGLAVLAPGLRPRQRPRRPGDCARARAAEVKTASRCWMQNRLTAWGLFDSWPGSGRYAWLALVAIIPIIAVFWTSMRLAPPRRSGILPCGNPGVPQGQPKPSWVTFNEGPTRGGATSGGFDHGEICNRLGGSNGNCWNRRADRGRG